MKQQVPGAKYRLSRLLRARRGVGMVEYAFLAMLIALGIVALVAAVGGDLRNTMTRVRGAFSGR